MRAVVQWVAAISLLAGGVAGAAQAPTSLPSEIPAEFKPAGAIFDYDREDYMIPMRDGVKLHTVVWRPKTSKTPMPIVLTRTPYDASNRPAWTQRPNSPAGASAVPLPDAPLIANGYIRVYQDVRGKYGSEGAYVMSLPPRGPLNAGPVDQTTDAWDTIDWLVKNVPGNNGRVGLIGVSYEGWTTLMGLLEPHPALKAAIPMNAMVDGWMGDDWYHNGAFRQFSLEYVYRQTTVKGASEFPFGSRDAYSAYLKAGSANAMASSRGMDQLPAWKKLIDNPAYTAFWQEQAVDKLLSKAPMRVPTLTVHGLYDQEDIYGPIASYAAMEAQDRGADRNFLVIGPWFHGQQDPWFHQASGSGLGPIPWGSDTTRTFLLDMMLPFFDQYLKGVAPAKPIPPVRAFETGSNVWRSHAAWPPPGVDAGKLYLGPAGGLTLSAPKNAAGYDQYVSDPAKPVPYRVPPIIPNDAPDTSWKIWLADDQRPFESRPDVLTYATAPLTEPVAISGSVIAHLVASTSGSDSDWVVKVIDAYPDEYPMQPTLGGYQLMISADIFRGRYRQRLDKGEALAPDQALPYRFALPNANHVFLPGHRIVVQIQSSWFPLYDRNPQTFVPNIAYAKPGDYRAATQRIYFSSYIELPLRSGQDTKSPRGSKDKTP
ncbi:CocE/NonD family hydrolase [Phenylobacterium sp. LjRoot225]|uniref:CocE/NonD family hydrolase n=1 Tax=Phenylobacterium sp. LjRoot225 TaxID=3342285 RepID=UPI003ECFA480